MKDNLYFIANEGCDATTCGIAIISDEDFPKFKAIIENLNKNSTYGCMPTISVYKSSWDNFREFTYNPNAKWEDDDYVEDYNTFYLNEKTYTFAEKYTYFFDWERVI